MAMEKERDAAALEIAGRPMARGVGPYVINPSSISREPIRSVYAGNYDYWRKILMKIIKDFTNAQTQRTVFKVM